MGIGFEVDEAQRFPGVGFEEFKLVAVAEAHEEVTVRKESAGGGDGFSFQPGGLFGF